MIVVETMLYVLQKILYLLLRPIIWISTARDCRHCEHGCRVDYRLSGWSCNRNYDEFVKKCMYTPWRANFARSKYRTIRFMIRRKM